ncbi:MAG: hypothetical protein ACRC3J_01795 [Culicoidibacterales bacterium]
MRVVGLISDGGDGSASLQWFTNIELAESYLDDDEHCEQFGMNEGSFAADLTLPDGTDLEAMGIRVWSENA